MKQIFPILTLWSKTEQNINNSEESAFAFVPAWFWPFSKLGLFGFFIRWEHVGGSGVCSSLKKEKNAQTIRTKLVAKMLKLVRYQELPIYIQQNCDTGQEPPAVCLRARFDLF